MLNSVPSQCHISTPSAKGLRGVLSCSSHSLTVTEGNSFTYLFRKFPFKGYGLKDWGSLSWVPLYCHIAMSLNLYLRPNLSLSRVPTGGYMFRLHASVWGKDSPTCSVDICRSRQRRSQAFSAFTCHVACKPLCFQMWLLKTVINAGFEDCQCWTRNNSILVFDWARI